MSDPVKCNRIIITTIMADGTSETIDVREPKKGPVVEYITGEPSTVRFASGADLDRAEETVKIRFTVGKAGMIRIVSPLPK
jgi:hypothetical protein